METVAYLYNLEVDPSIIHIGDEIVFRDELLQNFIKAGSDKFWSIHRRCQVKISDFKSCKACITAGEDTVDYKFNKL